jgi:hypothetical protein
MESLGRYRHKPFGIKELIDITHGFHDTSSENGTFAAVKVAIDAGHPVILHGSFTPSGHIIGVHGVDHAGFLVTDP